MPRPRTSMKPWITLGLRPSRMSGPIWVNSGRRLPPLTTGDKFQCQFAFTVTCLLVINIPLPSTSMKTPCTIFIGNNLFR